jgi:hypothetical protein
MSSCKPKASVNILILCISVRFIKAGERTNVQRIRIMKMNLKFGTFRAYRLYQQAEETQSSSTNDHYTVNVSQYRTAFLGPKSLRPAVNGAP